MKLESELEILRLVHQNWSFWAIKRHFKAKNLVIHYAQIVCIKKKYSSDQENQPPSNKPSKPMGRPLKLSPREIFQLKKSVLNQNSRPNNELERKYNAHPTTIGRYIGRNLKLARNKKRKVHDLSEKEKLRRFQRSLPLYRFLKANLHQIITSDEKIF